MPTASFTDLVGMCLAPSGGACRLAAIFQGSHAADPAPATLYSEYTVKSMPANVTTAAVTATLATLCLGAAPAAVAQPTTIGPITVGGSAHVQGPVTIHGTLTVAGRVHVSGPLTAAWFSGPVQAHGVPPRPGYLKVFDGPLTVQGPMVVQGDLHVDGPLTVDGPLQAAGGISSNGPLREREYN